MKKQMALLSLTVIGMLITIDVCQAGMIDYNRRARRSGGRRGVAAPAPAPAARVMTPARPVVAATTPAAVTPVKVAPAQATTTPSDATTTAPKKSRY